MPICTFTFNRRSLHLPWLDDLLCRNAAWFAFQRLLLFANKTGINCFGSRSSQKKSRTVISHSLSTQKQFTLFPWFVTAAYHYHLVMNGLWSLMSLILLRCLRSSYAATLSTGWLERCLHGRACTPYIQERHILNARVHSMKHIFTIATCVSNMCVNKIYGHACYIT